MFVVVDRRDFPLISSADLVKFEHRRKFYDAIKNEINEIVEFAKNSPEPDESELLTEIYN